MAYLNTDASPKRTFDAIVIGSGISGGWAAKELTEKGLNVLLVERGRNVIHGKDYPTTNMNPWEFKHRGKLPLSVVKENPVVSRCYAFKEDSEHFFVKDKEHPYVQVKPFDWIRGYQVGGKSLIWARQTQRWSDYDFEGPARDDFAVDWPIRYRDLAPWYSHVERFIGVSGNKDRLPQLPDGEFLPPMQQTCVEKHLTGVVNKYYNKKRPIIIGRCAHITKPEPIFAQQGRTLCQHRVLCQRGCPFGGYYSSNASTIPWAIKTGKLILLTDTVVHSLIYDEKYNKVSGIRVIDAITKQASEYYAKIFFVNAGALNTNLLLLNSVSNRFPAGLGNDNGLLGRYVAFHNYRATISATYDGFENFMTDGRRPTGSYLPRFRNVFKQETDFLRGYAAGISAVRYPDVIRNGVGSDLKNNLIHPEPGSWKISSHMMAETIPKYSNYVALSNSKYDAWGIPQLEISIDYDQNDEQIIQDYFEQVSEMFDQAGFKHITTKDNKQAPGLDIHEMGGVRMGKDSQTSLLNKWNQLHHCKNVFVTDGACMTSTSTQNPSLTYMAMTARAVNFAVDALKKIGI